MSTRPTTDYDKVIEALFNQKMEEYTDQEVSEIPFSKDELTDAANKIGIIIRNPPDIIYTYRTRQALPDSILAKGNWILRPRGKGRFAFYKTKRTPFIEFPREFAEIEILNALPEIVEKYTEYDEQGLLSAIRYNRLVDIFSGITCFHLQSHIRTTIEEEGQIEIDDLYVGIDNEGTEYILPLEAKSPEERDKLGWVQVANLVKYSKQNFPKLKCRPICAKPIDRNTIFMVEFEDKSDFEEIRIKNIKLYKFKRENLTT